METFLIVIIIVGIIIVIAIVSVLLMCLCCRIREKPIQTEYAEINAIKCENVQCTNMTTTECKYHLCAECCV
ncbi:MAG: hypothetical protein EZS28_022096, partial [Streblomastix strix]